MDSPQDVKRKDIADGLARLGIQPGAVIMVHSSLKSFGHVDGGPDAVIDGLADAVGPTGLVVVPTLTKTYVEGEVSGLAFHPARTPSRVGKITDVFWRRPEARRSGHPSHSVAAIGERAEELVEFHGPDSHFGRHTPYGKYVRWGAQIVLLGVGQNSNTTIHAIEDWSDMPTLKPGKAVVEDDDGTQREVVVHGVPAGCRDFYRRDSKAEQLFKRHNLIQQGTIGACTVTIMDAQAMERVMMHALYTDQPDLLCCERPECDFCAQARIGCFERFIGEVPKNLRRKG